MLVAMNRSGSVAIVDDRGREKERYQVVYGARLRVEDGQKVALGDQLAEWDPYTYAVLTEIGGTVQFKDLQEGITLNEEVDEVTGLSRLVVSDAPDEKRQPAIWINGAKGKKRYLMPSRAHLDGAGRRHRWTGRHSRQDPARVHSYQGHHRWSAARRRALRSPQAARDGHHLRDRRHCSLRRSGQGTAQDLCHRGQRRREANTPFLAARTSTSRKASAFLPAIR